MSAKSVYIILNVRVYDEREENYGGRKIFCVYGEKSSLIRTRYV